MGNTQTVRSLRDWQKTIIFPNCVREVTLAMTNENNMRRGFKHRDNNQCHQNGLLKWHARLHYH